MTRLVLGALLLAGVSAYGCGGGGGGREDALQKADTIPPGALPRFTPEDDLMRPEGWEGWVLAGTSMGLTYTEPATAPAPGEPPGRFLNVYIQPWAYERFMETGEFPEGTMFILAGSEPVRKADPARGGFYQGALRLLEVHLKQQDLHETGWGFYGFGGGEETARLIPGDAACYSCHRDEAAYDHAFVQFYPAMRERLGLAAVDPDSNGGGT